MARIAPFRGFRYAGAGTTDLSPVIAPPYDVIGPAERRRLASHPHNIVHVDLPLGTAGGDPTAGVDPYDGAAALLRTWMREGVLARDPAEALYVVEHGFREAGGVARRRRGLFARLRLEPFEAGVVIPHERTLDAPRTDRTRLLAATRAHLSPVFLLHPDPEERIARLVAPVTEAPAAASAATAGGETVRLWTVTEPEVVRTIVGCFVDHWVLIADGHHRYESALAYQADRTAAGDAAAGMHILAFLCSVADPGLRILPIHRVVHSLPGFRPGAVRESLGAWFDLQPLGDVASLPFAVAAEAGRAGVFGLVFGGEPGGWIARWRDGAGLETPGLERLPEPLRRLDVVLLHQLVFERALGLDADRMALQENLVYVKDTPTILASRRQDGLAVILNPTRLEQVIEASRRGLRLPQKSTFFHPKVPTGLVIDTLDPAPAS